jgi:Zn finger protein HypA/HybF involved in hydrogenase expression
LNIEIIKGEAECMECKEVFPMNIFGTSCPNCGSYRSKILRGREMKILNLVIDD